MEYTRSRKYDTPELRAKIMGPHPMKLCEELLRNHQISDGATIMDLGSGQGVTSVFLAKEYGFRVYATDLWSEPEENQVWFDAMGIPHDQLIPVKADATNMPFDPEFFDAVVSIDSYNYFGRDPEYLDRYLLPLVKPGGLIYIAIPGLKKDCHDNLPPELLLSWTPDQLAYMHDTTYWRNMVAHSSAQVLSVREMESNEEIWADWLACDNEYAINDRKTFQAGGGRFLNFIAMILRK